MNKYVQQVYASKIIRRSLACLFSLFMLLPDSHSQLVPFSYWKSQAPSGLPPTTAFGVRKIVNNYSGPLIRVRRSSDNAEQDIGFTVGGDLDTASLTTFVGAGNGFVRTWYDQSGNARHATQTTTTAQPQIVTSGSVELTNGKPTLRFNGSFWLSLTRPVTNDWSLVASFTATHTHASDGWWNLPGIFGGEVSGGNDGTIGGVGSGMWFTGVNTSELRGNYINVIDGVMRVGSQRRTRSTGLIELWLNGLGQGSGFANTTSVTAPATFAIGAAAANGTGNRWIGSISEIMLYDSVISEDERQTVEASQANYFSISMVDDMPSGISGVYSVRRVIPSYSGPLIRVRRSSDNAEQDIGFDGSGELDLSALTAFVGSGSAFVRTWYDQGLHNYDAFQTTTGSQPRIMNAGVVDTANGKPTIRFLGSQWMRVYRPVVRSFTSVATFWSTNSGTGAWTGEPNIFGGDISGSPLDFGIGAVTQGKFHFGISSSTLSSSSTNIVNDGTLKIGSTRRQSSTGLVEIWLRGVLEGSATLTTALMSAPGFMGMGSNADGGGARWVGAMSEIYTTEEWLDDTARAVIQESQRDYFSVGLASGALICDSGSLDTTCYINKEKIISSASVTGTGNLIIQNNGSITPAIATSLLTLNFNDITIETGGRLVGNITLNATGNVVMQSGSQFLANNLGHVGVSGGNGNGPGGGIAAGGNGGSGGSYGGVGGTKSGGGAASATYGSLTNPVDLGSAGGAGGVGGNGGGAVRINATGSVTMNGTVSVNGQVGGSTNCTGAGGGSGGSIWITGSSVSGSGSLSANGGNGGPNGCGGQTGMGGGGGRIAIFGNYNFSGAITVAGGFVGGNEGTVYIDDAASGNICNSGTLATTCTISSTRVLADGYSITGTGDLVFANGAVISVAGGTKTFSINMSGDVTVQTGATITANISNLQANNFTLQSGATMSANFLGHPGGSFGANGAGPGGGVANSNGGGGGGHGSVGVTRGGAGGAVYGSDASPVTWGSGGGAGGGNSIGGSGGGAIRITATGTATINGTLRANGQAAPVAGNCHGGGGGAGGSVWITGGNLSGTTGVIETLGGEGGQNGCGAAIGAGGGGGRVSLQTSGTYFGGTIDVKAFQKIDMKGVIYSSFADINTICDSGNLSTTCTISTKKYLGDNQLINGTGNLIIANGGQLISLGGEQRLRIDIDGNLTVQNGGLIEANLPTFEMNNLDIQTGGIVRASGKGFVGGSVWENGSGPGGGIHNASGAGGGGHGGLGGQVQAATAGATYGSATNPVTYGSGGGGSGSSVNGMPPGGIGGAGGGAVKIVAAGSVTLNGTLAANGNVATGWASCWGGSGGAGGSIWIVSTSFSGNGNLQAYGEVGSGNGCGSPLGPSGGGGRISVQTVSASSFTGTVDITSKFSGTSTPGGQGTLNMEFSNPDGLCDTGTLASTCTVSSAKVLPNNYIIAGTGNLVFASGAQINLGPVDMGSIEIDMDGDVTIQTGVTLRTNITRLEAANFTLQAGATLDASALGNVATASSGQGAGAGGAGNSTGVGGGGYGGAGATGGTSLGGTTYGLATAPSDFGSSGGNGSSRGGSGGGRVRINVTGTATVNGTINVDGGVSGNVPGGCCSIISGGGGSGGSIWITASTISGSGSLFSRGGATGTGNGLGSGGGGGRIRVEADKLFAGVVDLSGGYASQDGDGKNPASPGTYSATVSGNLCDSGDLSTTCTISTVKYVPDGFTFSGTGNLVVASGGQLLCRSGDQRFSINISGDLTVQNTGVIEGNLNVINAQNVNVNTGGIIRADGKGFVGRSYAAGYGPGAGSVGTWNGGTAGAGYGGAGGTLGTSNGGAAYGSLSNPTDFGSSGGGSNSAGGNGGGAIRINNSGILTVNGSLSAKGGNAPYTTSGGCCKSNGGGGSGGSIWITAGSVAGSGTISTAGGKGFGAFHFSGAGGGGGRISIESTNYFPGVIDVAGGSYLEDGDGRYPGFRGTYHASATSGICDSGSLATVCVITSSKALPDGTTISGTGSLDIQAGGGLAVYGGNMEATLTMSQDITIASGVTLRGNITLNANNLTLASGATINANELGHTGRYNTTGLGPGGGNAGGGDFNGASGGGHGGAGGRVLSILGGATNGSLPNPVTWGSAGGGYTTVGGTGGGAVRLNITSLLTVNGSISADGGTAPQTTSGGCCKANGGGGAGGSIWITAGSVAGTGTLSVKGGDSRGLYHSPGGAGGGGRISIESTNLFSGIVQVDGGSYRANGDNLKPGVRGTYHASASGNICDTGDLSTTCTISSARAIPDGFAIAGAGNLVLQTGAQLTVYGGTRTASIDMGGNITLQTGVVITGNLSLLEGTNIDVQTGAQITADGMGNIGHWNLVGEGSGPGAAGNGGGGGGHGGAGGTVGGAGGTTYGSATNPTAWGSSGGGYTTAGGVAGGALRISASTSITINGNITSDGLTSPNTTAGGCCKATGGGGAGGSIWISAPTVTGNGVIYARGGSSGVNHTRGGGGGGGRIAGYTAGFTGTVSAAGGVVTGANNGAAGSTTP